MDKTKKILCLMDYGKDCRTGFATVSKNIKAEVKKAMGSEVELHICAVNHFGENYTEDDGTIVFSAKRNDVKADDFGRFAFLKILNDSEEYDGIFIIQDLGVIQPIIGILESVLNKKKKEGKKQFKSMWYFPVDCRLFPALVKNLEFFDTLVTYTNFGRDEVLRLRPDLRGKIKVVYHGNNPKDFYPIEDISEFRKSFFGENADKVIITNVNRNQPRKDITNTIFGFIEAWESWDETGIKRDPFLYLHCHPKDPMGHDLRAVLMQTELVEYEDYMLIPKRFEENMCTTEELNKIYNSCDIYLTTTLGEGWGLTITEAFSTKTPVIAPNTTSITEISGGGTRAYLLNTIVPCCFNTDNIIREQTDSFEVGETIKKVAKSIIEKDPTHISRVEKAYEWTKTIEWKLICKRWVEYFKSTY